MLVVAGRVFRHHRSLLLLFVLLIHRKNCLPEGLCAFLAPVGPQPLCSLLFLLLRGENNELRFSLLLLHAVIRPPQLHLWHSKPDLRSPCQQCGNQPVWKRPSVLQPTVVRLAYGLCDTGSFRQSGSPSASSPHRISISSGGRLRAWSSSGLKPSRCGTGVAQVDEKTITSLSSIGSEWWRARHCLLTRGELDGLYGGVGRPVSGFKMLSFPMRWNWGPNPACPPSHNLLQWCSVCGLQNSGLSSLLLHHCP